MSVDFDGASQYLVIPNSASLRIAGALTVTAWIISENISWREIFESYYQNPNVAGIEFRQDNNNKLQLVSGKNTGSVLGTDYQQVSSAASINTGARLHVAGRYDGATLKVYINGVQDGTVAWANNPVYDAANNRVRVGVNEYVGTTKINYFDGPIEEVRLFPRALSIQELAILVAGYRGPLGGEVLWLSCQDFAGIAHPDGAALAAANALTDLSGNNNDGVPTNSPIARASEAPRFGIGAR